MPCLRVPDASHSTPQIRSQFYFTFRATPHLDKKHTVFGKLVGGEDVLDALEALPVKPGTERPAKPVRITEVVMYVTFCLSFESLTTDMYVATKIHSKSTKLDEIRSSRRRPSMRKTALRTVLRTAKPGRRTTSIGLEPRLARGRKGLAARAVEGSVNT